MISDHHAMEMAKRVSIGAMLDPRSIAIVGATDRAGYGARFLNNLLRAGERVALHPVNPNRSEVLGVPCHRSVEDIPRGIDLAAILVPGKHVLPSYRACIERGVKSALIVSAGFSELGTQEGRAQQAEISRLARESGVRVCGPNCLGLANVVSNVWANAATRFPAPLTGKTARIGVVSQSGATIYRILVGNAQARGIPLRYLVATGNEADLASSDFILSMLRDPEIATVAAVVEGFRDGARFVEAADLALSLGKPIVLLKIGRTEIGSRAASSHTAAMTGSDAVQDALFRQKGVIRVDDYDELLETAAMFSTVKIPRGKRVGIVSESGGMGSFMADKCAEEGLEVPTLSGATRDKLVAVMGERGAAANPADLTSFATGEDFPKLLDTLLAEEQQDILLFAMGAAGVRADAIAAAAAQSDKPVLFCWCSERDDPRDQQTLALLRAAPVGVFHLPGKAAKAIRRLAEFNRLRRLDRSERNQPGSLVDDDPRIAHMLKGGPAILGEHEGKKLLSLSGVAANSDVRCNNLEEALEAAGALGYPVALKISSPDIAHKTEAGGVELGLADDIALSAAYERIMRATAVNAPYARIEGILVQRMISGGVETIVGISRDAQFGAVLMLGLGGVLAEALGAATWRICPINQREALEMIGEVRGLPRLLAGFRGQPKGDIDALADVLVSVARLALQSAGTIASLDINPLAVMARGRGAIALDALVTLNQHQSEEILKC